MEVEFNHEQKYYFLQMHGFRPDLIKEATHLGQKMSERLEEFRLKIQDALYRIQVENCNQELENELEKLKT